MPTLQKIADWLETGDSKWLRFEMFRDGSWDVIDCSGHDPNDYGSLNYRKDLSELAEAMKEKPCQQLKSR